MTAGHWRAGGAIALAAGAVLLTACNSVLGIDVPVDLPPDAASEARGEAGGETLAPMGGDGGQGRDGQDGGDQDSADQDSADADRDADARDGGVGQGDADPEKDASPEVGPGDSGVDAGEPPPPPLIITTTALPHALYNVSYSATFTASGGGGTEPWWTVTSGALPQGLDLEPGGTLHGIPLQEGAFEVDVTVTELAPGAAAATKHFTLVVARKRWLVYRANSYEDLDEFTLYAVDVRNPAVQIKVSSNIPASMGSVGKFDFSPDGTDVAFLGQGVTDVPQLYVVDMTGDLPGAPRKVNEYGMVRDFSWSPDSRSLSFAAELDPGTDILVADVTQPQSHPVRAGSGAGLINELGFVTDDLLTYWLDDLAFTRRSQAGGFGPSQLLTFAGGLVQRWPDLQSGLFASHGENCQDPTWRLIDFHDPLMLRDLTGYVSVSPGRDFIAHRQNPDYQYSIYSTWGSEPLVSFPTGSHFCAPGGWSHDGRLFVAAGDGDTLQVTRTDGATVTTGPLAGAYGTVAENGPPVFSPDDRWLGFATNQGAFLAKNDHGALGAALGGGIPITAQFGEPRLAFSPDSTRLASGEAGSTDRTVSTRLTDLRQDPPKTVDLYLGGSAGGAVYSLGWSVHSTELALVVRDGAYPSAANLYLYLPAHTSADAPSAQNITAFNTCQDGVPACPMVPDFEFQP